ncbi:hypothetical protein [Paractinoplanes atraurantiacus]|uniref:4-amino-4-deoxy-L-arabinose transferase n=1 Tax=Paractinoplanes atraurantiacus TaxID=1036182 RepID=A0A285JKQ1_9ACTN|nr:hypothetical protein [Actinoplanes atraurantiacus]SNY60910.1 hypothetical protein SAMN05421748_12229 [Actinoplanes atraurantiacus]
MTVLAEKIAPAPLAPAPERPPGRRFRPSAGWLPFLLVVAAVALTLDHYGVAPAETATFAGYTLFANTLPGLLIWRSVRGRADYLPLDAALGTVAGFIVELPLYMLVRQLDVPYAIGVWPLMVLVLFAVVPRLRRHWRGGGRRLPLGTSWTVAVSFLWILALVAFSTLRSNGLSEPLNGAMSVDFPFQFALAGEFKHPVPLNTPWVTGIGLNYHWYVYAHAAAASWLTGIEPQTLILRLLPLPMVAAFLLALVAAVRQITGRFWPGNVAVLLMLAGTSVNPFSWTGSPFLSGIITTNLFVSPTQTYAALFFAAVVLHLAVLFQLDRKALRRPMPWAVLTVLMGALAGAKATFIPMVLCGLLLAVVLRGVFTRRLGPELPVLGITLLWFAFAQFVLYGSGSQGAVVNPFQTVKWSPVGQAVMGLPDEADQWPPMLALTGFGILATAFGWAGMAGLLRRGWRSNPIVHVMLGFAAAGTGGMWLVAHPGLSQTYFAQSATPYLAMASAVGLAALIPAGRRAPRKFIWLGVYGVTAAVAGLLVIRSTAGADAPASMFGGFPLRSVVMAYTWTVSLVAVVGVTVALIAWRVRLPRRLTVAVLALTVLSTAVASGLIGSTRYLATSATAQEPARLSTFPRGALEAGRWLRDHSGPRDVVATNSHCRQNIHGCDSRDFWLAAYSERQIVVEGWSYTEPAFASGGLWDGTLSRSPFWDQALLAENDALFYVPTAENVAAFTTAHNVRWLVAVDWTQDPTDIGRTRFLNADPALADFATERFRSGAITVYEVSPAPSESLR